MILEVFKMFRSSFKIFKAGNTLKHDPEGEGFFGGVGMGEPCQATATTHGELFGKNRLINTGGR